VFFIILVIMGWWYRMDFRIFP